VLLAVDEIVTGLGRTGEWFGVRRAGVQPDMMALSKGITAGYFPFGIAAVHKRLEPAFEGLANMLPHGFTNCGHPMGCAAAVATIRYIKEHDVLLNVNARGEEIRALLQRLADHCPIIGDVRGAGMLTCVEFVKDKKSKEKLDQKAFMDLHAYASKHHALRLRGLNTWSLCINPASTITKREVYQIIVPLGRTLIELGYCDEHLKRIVDEIEADGKVLDPPLPHTIALLCKAAAFASRPQTLTIALAVGIGFVLGRRL